MLTRMNEGRASLPAGTAPALVEGTASVELAGRTNVVVERDVCELVWRREARAVEAGTLGVVPALATDHLHKDEVGGGIGQDMERKRATH